MADACKGLDDFCVWVERLLRWVDRTEAPPLPWIGPASGRCWNPPAPHLEIIYVVEGEFQRLRVGERMVSIPSGAVSIHNVHQGNYADEDEAPARTWCVFLDVSAEREFAHLADASLTCVAPVADEAALVASFQRLQARCAALCGPPGGYLTGENPAYRPERAGAESPAAGWLVKAALLELLATLLREGERHHGRRGALPVAVQRAVAYLNLHYAEPDITLDAVATAAGLSPDHFGRQFRESLGLPPMRYLQTIRIDRSLFLLRHSALRVEEIARAVGFRDAFYFSRVCRRHTGQSPTTIREAAEA